MLVRGQTGGEAPVVRASGGGGTGGYVQGATALKGDLAESAPLTIGGAAFAPAAESVADKRAEARMKGYVGEALPRVRQLHHVRNGTCLKCDTCGSTTGCREGKGPGQCGRLRILHRDQRPNGILDTGLWSFCLETRRVRQPSGTRISTTIRPA